MNSFLISVKEMYLSILVFHFAKYDKLFLKIRNYEFRLPVYKRKLIKILVFYNMQVLIFDIFRKMIETSGWKMHFSLKKLAVLINT